MYDDRKLIEAFEVCVSELEAGADLDSVLKLYPDMTVELRPLLETVDRALLMSVSEVPQEVVNRGRTKLLGHAATMRKAAVKPRKSGLVIQRWAVSLLLALVFFLGGTGVVNASSATLPGDNLYPVKRAWEEVRLLFERSPSRREALESEYEQERLDEIGELLADGREETISFSGIVTAQNESYWVVSDVPVQVDASTRLPVEAISVGAPVTVVGRTNAQGFILAERVSLLEPGASLPPLESEELEKHREENSSDEVESEKPRTYKFQGVVTSQQGNIWYINSQRVNVLHAEIKGEITTGDFVEFEGYYDDNREFMVTKIELKSYRQSLSENEKSNDNSNEDSGNNNGDDDDNTKTNNNGVDDDDNDNTNTNDNSNEDDDEEKTNTNNNEEVDD